MSADRPLFNLRCSYCGVLVYTILNGEFISTEVLYEHMEQHACPEKETAEVDPDTCATCLPCMRLFPE
jgi:hypothetical protein